MEIYWRDNFSCPTEAEYRLMTCRKTGGLFNLAVRLMQLFSSSAQDFSQLASLLGLYFQIRLAMQSTTENKILRGLLDFFSV
jgi:geranylgeranyl diphosphate synthase type 3